MVFSKEGGNIHKVAALYPIMILCVAALLVGCAFMELGSIVDIGGSVDPDPGTATPTSWYILNVFHGTWEYRFFEGETVAQTYQVTHKVSNKGVVDLTFTVPESETKLFLATGTIDMDTGLFNGFTAWGRIGNEEGSLSLSCTFATPTLSLQTYQVVLESRFSPGSFKYYSVSGMRLY